MSIKSMTGYGRCCVENEEFYVSIEIKSVNHRFFDFKIKQPSFLNYLDLQYRKKIKQKFKRGSFDLSIMVKKIAQKSKADEIDWDKVKSYIKSLKINLKEDANNIHFNATEFLRNEFLLDQDNTQNLDLKNLIFESLDGALISLEKARVEEGEKLKSVLISHKLSYENHFKLIAKNADCFEENIKDRILKKFNDYSESVEVEKPRFLQEVIYYLEKIDIHEEINRIESHLSKIDKILTTSDSVGRELEFMLQELNRETNTIGSKSCQVDISDSVVKMKVELEKMREQSLNLE